jgi:hypothetical protein
VDWCITPAFVEKAAGVIQSLKVVDVLLRSKPVQITDFKIRPLMLFSIILQFCVSRETYKVAFIVALAVVIADEF